MIRITSCENECNIKTHTHYKDLKVLQFWYNSIYNDNYIQDTEIDLEDTKVYIQGYDTHFKVSIGSQYLNYVPDLALSYVVINGVVKKAEFGNVEEVTDETSGDTKVVVNVTLKNFYIKDEDSIKIILYYEQTIPGIFKYTIVGDAGYNTTKIYEASEPTDDIFGTGEEANYDSKVIFGKVTNGNVLCSIQCSNNRSNNITPDMFYNFKPYKVYIKDSQSSLREITDANFSVVTNNGTFLISFNNGLPQDIKSIECQYYATVPKLQHIYGAADELFNASDFKYNNYGFLYVFMPSNVWNFLTIKGSSKSGTINADQPYIYSYLNSQLLKAGSNDMDKYTDATDNIHSSLSSSNINCTPYIINASGTALDNGYIIKFKNTNLAFYIQMYEDIPDNITTIDEHITSICFKNKKIKSINRYKFLLTAGSTTNSSTASIDVMPLVIENDVYKSEFVTQSLISDDAGNKIYTKSTTNSNNAFPLILEYKQYSYSNPEPINIYRLSGNNFNRSVSGSSTSNVYVDGINHSGYYTTILNTGTSSYYKIGFLSPELVLDKSNDNTLYNICFIAQYSTNIQH